MFWRDMRVWFVSSVVLGLLIGVAHATFVADDFSYPSGVLYSNNAGVGWITPWGRNAVSGQYSSRVLVNSGFNLTYSGSGGYNISQTGSGHVYGNYESGFRGMNRDLTNLTGTVWFSALVRDEVAMGHAGIQFNNPNSTDYLQGGWDIDLWNTNLIVRYNSVATTNTTINLALSTTHLIVGRITFQANGSNDRFEVWADPINLTNVYNGSESALFSADTADMGASLFRVGVFGWGTNATSLAMVDALRLSDGGGDTITAFAEVTGVTVPEPSALVLVVAGLGLLCVFRRWR